MAGDAASLPQRNVIYVQGPYYNFNSSGQPIVYSTNASPPVPETPVQYWTPVLAVPASVFILCFGHFNAKGATGQQDWGLVINNVAATDPSMAAAMAPVKAAAANGATFLLSIGGADNPDDWTHIGSAPDICAAEVAAFLTAYGLKGVDIDMENSANPGAVAAFLADLAARVPGLIVSGSPMLSQMQTHSFFPELLAASGYAYPQWFNVQYYQYCETPSLGSFEANLALIAGWYGTHRPAAVGDAVVIGVAPTQCGGQESVAKVLAAAAAIAAAEANWGGFAWWNYPELVPPSLTALRQPEASTAEPV